MALAGKHPFDEMVEVIEASFPANKEKADSLAKDAGALSNVSRNTASALDAIRNLWAVAMTKQGISAERAGRALDDLQQLISIARSR